MCELRQAFAEAGAKHGGGKEVAGYKLMVEVTGSASSVHWHGYRNLVESLCRLNVRVALMWRRNVLRRKISHAANNLDRASPDHQAHPRSPSELEAARTASPKLDADRLVGDIEAEERISCGIERLFLEQPSCPAAQAEQLVYYYEDLVDGAPGSQELWQRFLRTLGVRTAEPAAWPASSLLVVHGNTPVLETVSNPSQVKHTLEGTPHEWMLSGVARDDSDAPRCPASMPDPWMLATPTHATTSTAARATSTADVPTAKDLAVLSLLFLACVAVWADLYAGGRCARALREALARRTAGTFKPVPTSTALEADAPDVGGGA